MQVWHLFHCRVHEIGLSSAARKVKLSYIVNFTIPLSTYEPGSGGGGAVWAAPSPAFVRFAFIVFNRLCRPTKSSLSIRKRNMLHRSCTCRTVSSLTAITCKTSCCKNGSDITNASSGLNALPFHWRTLASCINPACATKWSTRHTLAAQYAQSQPLADTTMQALRCSFMPQQPPWRYPALAVQHVLVCDHECARATCYYVLPAHHH